MTGHSGKGNPGPKNQLNVDALFAAFSASSSFNSSPKSPFINESKSDSGGRNKAKAAMITRSNLAEQLREYQNRSKHDWASVSFFSSTSNLPSSR
ncbi:hypothetical protein Pint_09274 [Pistacia integerrima]|uniref:Uncharacterized protein n=1 Tax=Pistacia integerrima TaxID=434235 RepID=A0ACC0XZG0_9ROSI|nr:hypothetical protein Pint_09274 [Pistacia integerrima]